MNRLVLKHSVFLEMARATARLGTCCRLSVGCVLLRADGSVAGTGYNGSLPGHKHCCPETCNASARCFRTRHAERSALDYSQGAVATAYVTHEPCISCTKDLIARGCRAVYFLEPYAAKDEAENAAKREQIAEAKLSWQLMASNGLPAELRPNRTCQNCGCWEHKPFLCPDKKQRSNKCGMFQCIYCDTCRCDQLDNDHGFSSHIPDFGPPDCDDKSSYFLWSPQPALLIAATTAARTESALPAAGAGGGSPG